MQVNGLNQNSRIENSYDETNNQSDQITESDFYSQDEEIFIKSFKKKVQQAKKLADKLKEALPPVTPDNIDSILSNLISKAEELSPKERREKGIDVSDMRSAGTTNELVAAQVTGNTELFMTILQEEHFEADEEQKKLELMDEADSKGISYDEDSINNPSTLLDLEEKVTAHDELSILGLDQSIEDEIISRDLFKGNQTGLKNKLSVA